MGTPQFPDLGKHCTVDDCKQIDFFPFSCNTCRQIFCLEHRSYIKHNCSKANYEGVTVVICPLCAEGVCLSPDEDPNITWELHVNIECDPSNYEKVTKKRKCPVPGCREMLTFSNTIKCRDCTLDHCLKHRFGLDHKCQGPKKLVTGFPFRSLLSISRKDTKPNEVPAASSSRWSTNLLNVASSVRAKAEASMTKLSSEFSQALQKGRGINGGSGSQGGLQEQCPQCHAKFSSVTSLIDHVEKTHERTSNLTGVRNLAVDVCRCPRCSIGFCDAVALVEHVERDHSGASKA